MADWGQCGTLLAKCQHWVLEEWLSQTCFQLMAVERMQKGKVHSCPRCLVQPSMLWASLAKIYSCHLVASRRALSSPSFLLRWGSTPCHSHQHQLWAWSLCQEVNQEALRVWEATSHQPDCGAGISWGAVTVIMGIGVMWGMRGHPLPARLDSSLLIGPAGCRGAKQSPGNGACLGGGCLQATRLCMASLCVSVLHKCSHAPQSSLNNNSL